MRASARDREPFRSVLPFLQLAETHGQSEGIMNSYGLSTVANVLLLERGNWDRGSDHRALEEIEMKKPVVRKNVVQSLNSS
jgi:hypothetical protein